MHRRSERVLPCGGALAWRRVETSSGARRVVQQVIDHVVALRTAGARLAIPACISWARGSKYLPNEVPPT